MKTLLLSAIPLWSAISVALATSVMVFISARSMKGGVFGIVLNYFGVGMIFVLAGFIVISLNNSNSEGFSMTANNILFTLGYIIMAFAAHKLSQIVKGK